MTFSVRVRKAIGTVALVLIAISVVVVSLVGALYVIDNISSSPNPGLNSMTNKSTSTNSSASTTTSNAAPTSGTLLVMCSNCTPAISGESQYLTTIAWNIPATNSADDNVSEYQSQGNGNSQYEVTWPLNQYTSSVLFVDWSVQMQSHSGATLEVSFTLSNGLTTFCQSTTLFPDIVQGNYSASQSYSGLSCPLSPSSSSNSTSFSPSVTSTPTASTTIITETSYLNTATTTTVYTWTIATATSTSTYYSVTTFQLTTTALTVTTIASSTTVNLTTTETATVFSTLTDTTTTTVTVTNTTSS